MGYFCLAILVAKRTNQTFRKLFARRQYTNDVQLNDETSSYFWWSSQSNAR
jgi:hypothetical protein